MPLRTNWRTILRKTDIATWRDALRYLAESADAPPQARTNARTALATFDKARELSEHARQEMHQAITALNVAEQTQVATVVQQLTDGKKANLSTLVQRVNDLRQERDDAVNRDQLATNVYNVATSRITGGVLNGQHHELLTWIATRRQQAGTTCAEVEQLPTQVQTIYAALDAWWLNDWREPLDLMNTQRLPLIYDATWPAKYRASVAWAWEQLARGLVERINTNPDDSTSATKYVAMSRVVTLPQVPPVPQKTLDAAQLWEQLGNTTHRR